MNLLVRLQALSLCMVCTAALALPSATLHHRVRLEGHGPRTVIFEAGLGDTLDVWKDVQPLIPAGCTRPLAYTRAGYPGSDPAGGPRDPATIVAEPRGDAQRPN